VRSIKTNASVLTETVISSARYVLKRPRLKHRLQICKTTYFHRCSNAVLAGGEAVIRVEPNNPNTILSIDNYTQFYIFVNGVVGVIAKWFRPAARRSINYLTQKRDKEGNFCK